MSQLTKRALAQSLKNLLLKKPFTKITVNDIAKDCGISRMTFYYHFKDLYDLIEWSCTEDVRKALEEKDTCETWQAGLLQIFEVMRENKPFLTNICRCVHKEQTERFIKPFMDRLILKIVREESGDVNVSEADKTFIARAYSYIFVGIMLDWIRDDMREEPGEIVERLGLLLRGTIRDALTRFQTPDAGNG